jgi:predicted dienelactone hydrolase
MITRAVAMLIAGLIASSARAAAPDTPELGGPGPLGVGVTSVTFRQSAQPDVLGYDAASKTLPSRDRVLPVDVWYPAKPAPGATPVTYHGQLTGEDGKDVAFSIPGAAIGDAAALPGPFPLVILSHGYGGAPEAMSWAAEALASKGYVVVGPHFNDPPITEAGKFAGPLTRRPLDIAFVTAEAQGRGRAKIAPFENADPERTVLLGYSMGGYGSLTAAGALLDTRLGVFTHGVLTPYARGGAKAAALKVANLKAVVVISPASRFGAFNAWGADGLGAVTAPTLFIVGSQDHVVGYDPGVKTLFDLETRAPRYLLTFANAGHSIGMDPAPEQMRTRLWDQDWWEDPVWRKARLIAIETHFITAFLDFYVKGDAAKAAYLDVPEPVSNLGVWPAKPGDAYDRVSPGITPVTVWKGFQRDHAAGLELLFAPPSP